MESKLLGKIVERVETMGIIEAFLVLFQEVGGGSSALFGVSAQDAEAGELIDGCELVETQLEIGDAAGVASLTQATP